jgi:hypothetical protein
MVFNKYPQYIQSNGVNTNRFEAYAGTLNIAPIKISGQYKIVVDLDNNLLLDDYCGRTKVVDKSIKMLPQIADFLSVGSNIIDTKVLRYGATQHSTKKQFHIPLYLGYDRESIPRDTSFIDWKTSGTSLIPSHQYPKYFVISKIPNQSIPNETWLYQYGDLYKIVDLEALGFWRIFDEVYDEDYYEYPLYCNFKEYNMILYGVDYYTGRPSQKTIDITHYAVNQPYFDNYNNFVLNQFKENGLFYPKFINIEVQFEYDNSIKHSTKFQNFFGFISNHIEIDPYRWDNEAGILYPLYDEVTYRQPEDPKIPYRDSFFDNKLTKLKYYAIMAHNNNWKGLAINALLNEVDENGNLTYPLKNIELEPYRVSTGTIAIQEIGLQQPQFKYLVYTLEVGDWITITNNNNYGESYTFKCDTLDIIGASTLYERLVNMMNHFNRISQNMFIFSIEGIKLETSMDAIATNRFYLTITNNYLGFDISYGENFTIEGSKNFLIYDRWNVGNTNKFRGISENDVWVVSNTKLKSNVTSLVINDNQYNIAEQFIFNGYYVLRLDNPTGTVTPPKITKLTFARIEEVHHQKLLRFEPIPFYSYDDILLCQQLFDVAQYKQDLDTWFNRASNCLAPFDTLDDNEKEAIYEQTEYSRQHFLEQIGNINAEYMYEKDVVKDIYVNNVFKRSDKLTIDYKQIEIENHNQEQCLNMYFASVGSTSFMTPNTFNLAKDFGFQNGNPDPEKQSLDDYRYNWFLINGTCPDYLQKTYNELRYFNRGTSNKFIDTIIDYEQEKTRWEIPKITSRIMVCNESFAETVFLGVKYRLPSRFDGYQFAVYANFNDQKYNTLEYHFDVNDLQKTLYLSINRYLDFSDLIRGGKNQLRPLIDLSFFYYVRNGFNKYSDFLYAYNTAGIIIAEDVRADENINFRNYFNNYALLQKNDWIHKDTVGNEWICIRRRQGSTTNFLELFEGEKASERTGILFDNLYAFVYRDITYQGRVYPTKTATFIFKDCIQIEADYMWVKDVQVLFYDTSDMFLQYYDIDLKQDVLLRINNPETITMYGVPSQTTMLLGISDIDNITKDHPFPYEEYVEVILNKQEVDAGLESTFKTKMLRILLPVEMNINDDETIPSIDVIPGAYHRIKPLSFKEHYFKITYYLKSGYDINFKEPSQGGDVEVFTFKDFKVPIWDYTTPHEQRKLSIYTRQDILDHFGLPENQARAIASSGYSTGGNKYTIDLFDRNQAWTIVRELFLHDLKIKFLSDELVRKLFDDFTVSKLIDYTSMNPIAVCEDTYDFLNLPTENYINLTVFPNDKNLVIWNHFLEPKIHLPQRIRTAYFPLFKEVNLHKFQLNKYQNGYKLFNMFDERFGNVELDKNNPLVYNISSTGLWNEVTSPVSTLFVKNVDIEGTFVTSPGQPVNIFNIFMESYDHIEPYTGGNNEMYISSIDKNVDTWILNEYTKYILENFYKLDSLYQIYPEQLETTKDSTSSELLIKEYQPGRIDYEVDTKDTYIIYPNIKDENSTIKIIFKRK